MLVAIVPQVRGFTGLRGFHSAYPKFETSGTAVLPTTLDKVHCAEIFSGITSHSCKKHQRPQILSLFEFRSKKFSQHLTCWHSAVHIAILKPTRFQPETSSRKTAGPEVVTSGEICSDNSKMSGGPQLFSDSSLFAQNLANF